MIHRDLARDLEHAEPMTNLEAVRFAVSDSPLVWHALLLPDGSTPVPSFVLTGHINCHDCALCHTAGDFRDGGQVVPWLASYHDCTDNEEDEG